MPIQYVYAWAPHIYTDIYICMHSFGLQLTVLVRGWDGNGIDRGVFWGFNNTVRKPA